MSTDLEVGMFVRYHLQLYDSMPSIITYPEVGMFVRYQLQMYDSMPSMS